MKVAYQGREIQLPDFMIAGAAKSGTTTLYDFLQCHPQVHFPKATKEPHYFSFGGTPPRFVDGQFLKPLIWRTEDYLELYQTTPDGTLLGDGSTSYLYRASEAIAHMKKLYGKASEDIAMIIIIRNPVERALSHYNFLVRNGFEDLPFDVAIRQEVIARRKEQRWGFDYLGYGEYARGIQLFQAQFKRVKVVLFEELFDAERTSAKLCEFLGISPMTVQSFPKINPSGRPKSKWVTRLLLRNQTLKKAVNTLPASTKRSLLMGRDALLTKVLEKQDMSDEARVFLQRHYKYSILQLENVLGRRLTKWLE